MSATPIDVKWVVRCDQNSLDFCRSISEVIFVVSHAMMPRDEADFLDRPQADLIVIERVHRASLKAQEPAQ